MHYAALRERFQGHRPLVVSPVSPLIEILEVLINIRALTLHLKQWNDRITLSNKPIRLTLYPSLG